MSKSFFELCQRSRRCLVLIGLGHTILVIVTLWALYGLNLKNDAGDLTSSNRAIMVNASLLGFLGSLLYFGRKVYIYLITDKFRRVLQDRGITMPNSDEDLDKLQSVITGYYIYLSIRPIAGFVVGPLLLMAVLAGLTTLSNPFHGSEITMSTAGMYLIYVLSFIGGYSSSDLFDYFSALGSKLVSKLDIK